MRIPDQVLRLSVPVVLVVGGFLVARNQLVPPTFGDIGHYRAAAVAEIAAQPIRYAGADACSTADCHADVMETKLEGYHRGVSCEVCHGPSQEHVLDPEKHHVKKPKSRAFCPVCHTYLSARPTGFPQIIPENHNMPKPCIKCHDPHDPVPSEVPGECSACHRTIASLKSVSRHADLECTTCHETPEEHKTAPRSFRPSKPVDRQFCGRCHAEGTDVPEAIADAPKLNMTTHYPKSLCWQCHYPHQPEAR